MSEIPIDVDKVMRGLKDFQRTSVEYVFRRMYLDRDPTRRFLLADEVGLGKTMVARGVVARVIDHLKAKSERVDVVYICSNLAIARQNITRLNVSSEEDIALASRITLLPKTVKGLRNRRLNFITFTPDTSFRLSSSLGKAEERALLYRILVRAWGIKGKGILNLLQGNARMERFRQKASDAMDADLDDYLIEAFIRALAKHIEAAKKSGIEDVRSRFEDLCDVFGYARKTENIPAEQQRRRTAIVGELRNLLAASCIESLEPDLIILDEFQRFRALLHGDDEASVLARNLFEYGEARVLLLSATPYKMYTLTDDIEEDHYRDFIRTYQFLAGSDERTRQLEGLLRAFRGELAGTASPNLAALRQLKASIESMLRLVMCRTERLASDASREGMLVEAPTAPTRVRLEDLESYISLQGVADALGEEDVLEYWMSAPFVLNFMERYKLKQSFDASRTNPALRGRISRLLGSAKPLLLEWKAIEEYSGVDSANPRLRHLLQDTIGRGVWKALWMSPSLPYYAPRPPFDQAGLESFTKRLVFSCWKVVPKIIAGLLSYEAERLINPPGALNTPEERKKRKPLLRFSVSEGRPAGMPVLALIYPSEVLARQCDPLELASKVGDEGQPGFDDLLAIAASRMELELSKLSAFRNSPKEGPEDETWYWAASMILDSQHDPEASEDWWDEDLELAWFQGDENIEEEEEEDGEASAWDQHVDAGRKMARGASALGRPPADLAQTLALMGLAAPGPVALRALGRIAMPTEIGDRVGTRDAAAAIAFRFPSLFNQPESIALLRGINDKEPYWRRVLEYCAAGNLQAVMDEYCHVLKESLGLMDKPALAISDGVSAEVFKAMSLRAAPVGVDSVAPNARGQTWKTEPRRLRMRFALRFGDEKVEDGDRIRGDQVRTAFNSPFWPFVLATTSVGQEGLDFHPYCHAVVHWNLPSNPVDLEQREGRVHRYKGHAVRKNLSRQHGDAALASAANDPWQKMFELADQGRPVGSTEIFPFWVFPLAGGARIERHVLALPLSRDAGRIAALRRSLAVYRMVFGQPRQQELQEFLTSVLPYEQLQELAVELRIDLSPTTPS